MKVWWLPGPPATSASSFDCFYLPDAGATKLPNCDGRKSQPTQLKLSGEQTGKSVAHTVTLTPTMRDVLATLPKDGKFVLRRPNYPDRPFTGFSKGKKQLQDGLASLGACGVRSRPAYNGSRYRHIIQLAINHRSGALGGIVKVSYRRRRHLQTGPTRIGPWSNSAWLIGV